VLPDIRRLVIALMTPNHCVVATGEGLQSLEIPLPQAQKESEAVTE